MNNNVFYPYNCSSLRASCKMVNAHGICGGRGLYPLGTTENKRTYEGM
jgi:hypothetical protein